MSNQTWQETLVSASGDGAALSNSVAATSIVPTQARVTLAANKIWYPGQMLKVTAQGRISNIVTTPGSLTFLLKFGATTVATTQAIALNATAQTNVTFWLEWLLTCRAAGATGNFMHVGNAMAVSFGSGAALGTVMIPASAPAVGSNVDLTAGQLVDLQGQFSIANAGNSIQAHMYKLELLN